MSYVRVGKARYTSSAVRKNRGFLAIGVRKCSRRSVVCSMVLILGDEARIPCTACTPKRCCKDVDRLPGKSFYVREHVKLPPILDGNILRTSLFVRRPVIRCCLGTIHYYLLRYRKFRDKFKRTLARASGNFVKLRSVGI